MSALFVFFVYQRLRLLCAGLQFSAGKLEKHNRFKFAALAVLCEQTFLN